MSETDFYQDDAKQRAADAVKAVEALTSAEVVVAVRRRSGDYRAAAYHAGLGAMGLVVTYLLVAPATYSVGAIALDACFGFFVATVLTFNLDALARLLVPRSRRQANDDRAARATFYDLGISRTSGRNGILVYVSTFERAMAVVPDIGVNVGVLGAPYQAQLDELRKAVRRPNVSGFLGALEGLGPILGAVMPRAEDDVNELPDEVQ